MKQSKIRVVRGSSWFDHRDDARCTFRDLSEPYLSFVLLGFRVIKRKSDGTK